MVAELTNPASFCRRNGVPSLSADTAGYAGGPEGAANTGGAPSGRRSSAWFNKAAQRTMGTRAQLAEKYASAVVETYRRQHDVTENLAPDRPLACGVGKFVGWGGIGPVANLIEYLLGLDVDWP